MFDADIARYLEAKNQIASFLFAIESVELTAVKVL